MIDNRFDYGTLAKTFSHDDDFNDSNKVKVLVDGNKGLDFIEQAPITLMEMAKFCITLVFMPSQQDS